MRLSASFSIILIDGVEIGDWLKLTNSEMGYAVGYLAVIYPSGDFLSNLLNLAYFL
jgi:hypothetical protein